MASTDKDRIGWAGLGARSTIGAALCLLTVLSACDDECAAGTESCACFPNKTCNDELSCRSGFCVNLDAVGADGGTDGGGRGSADGRRIPTSTPGSDGGSVAVDGGGTTPQGQACESTAECAPVSGACRMPVCVSGRCDAVTKPEGTLIPDDTRGDCQHLRCGRGGELMAEVDGSDVPADDDNPCTESVCNGTQPEQRPAAAGAPSPTSSQTDGDCLRVVCDGAGDVTSQIDDDDAPPPPDDAVCEVGSCEDGSPGTANAPAGTACGDDQVCDASGNCISCIQNGSGCSASSTCCGGLCMNGLCASCAANTGDCDGAPSNGCESPVNSPTRCGSCTNDCTGRPFVQTAECVERSCQVDRCMGARADLDGDFENGCEAEAQVGETAYGRCTGATAAEDCGAGEACMRGVAIGGLVFLQACTATQTGCFCAFPCSMANECPPAPNGTARGSCGGGSSRCHLECVPDDDTCPTGMSCVADLSGLATASICVWD